MCECGAVGLVEEIYQKVLVELQAALLGVYIDLQQLRAFLHELGIKLFVPRTEQRVGQVQSFAVETELQHLRRTLQLVRLDSRYLWPEFTRFDPDKGRLSEIDT